MVVQFLFQYTVYTPPIYVHFVQYICTPPTSISVFGRVLVSVMVLVQWSLNLNFNKQNKTHISLTKYFEAFSKNEVFNLL